MEVLRDMAACPVPVTGSVVTIGAYDGVHLGHRAVIDEVRARASTLGVPTAVVTFDRHPAAVVRPTSAPRLLTDTDQKLELLADAGVDYTLVLHFDEERSHESAEDFVNEVLAGCLRARPPSQLAGVPPSAPRAAPSWSRPTSSTSTATSTASAPRFGSPVACAGKSASSPPTPSSPK